MKRPVPAILIFSFFISLFSCKTAKLSDAVEKQELGEYYDAAQVYKRVYAKTSAKNRPLRGAVAFNMAECYREISDVQRALNSYQNAIRYEYADSSALLHSATMTQKLVR
jgi:peptidoglycan-associated lipoprotein